MNNRAFELTTHGETNRFDLTVSDGLIGYSKIEHEGFNIDSLPMPKQFGIYTFLIKSNPLSLKHIRYENEVLRRNL